MLTKALLYYNEAPDDLCAEKNQGIVLKNKYIKNILVLQLNEIFYSLDLERYQLQPRFKEHASCSQSETAV